MIGLHSCGFVCACLSLWGVVQLLWLALLFYIESMELIHEAGPQVETITDYNAFLAATKDGYKKVARNCFIAAIIYALTFILALHCIKKAKARKAKKAKELEDDELFCTPKEVVPMIKEKVIKDKAKPKTKPSAQESETDTPAPIPFL